MGVQKLIPAALIIGLSGALLWHLLNIWRYGQYRVGEPNISQKLGDDRASIYPSLYSDRKIESNGWTHVGYYGSSKIYAKGNKRCLVDPNTGRQIFEYCIHRNSI